MVEYMIHKNYVKGRREETVTFTALGCQPLNKLLETVHQRNFNDKANLYPFTEDFKPPFIAQRLLYLAKPR